MEPPPKTDMAPPEPAASGEEEAPPPEVEPRGSTFGSRIDESRRERAEKTARLRRGALIAALLLVFAPAALYGGYRGLLLLRDLLPAVPSGPTPPTAPGDTATGPVAPRGAPAPAPAPDSAPAPAASPAPPAAPVSSPFEESLARLDALVAAGLPGLLPEEAGPALERAAVHRARAVEAAGGGDLDSAVRLVEESERDLENRLAKAGERFRFSMEQARAAYEEGRPKPAADHVGQALARLPEDPAALELAAAVAILPALLAARDDAGKARSAGDLEAERAALRRVLEIDPDDPDASARVGAVEVQLRERAFGHAIAAGDRALEERDLTAARKALREARGIDSAHAQTTRLRDRVARLGREVQRDGHLEAADRAVAADDWSRVRDAYAAAVAADPGYEAAVQRIELADRILAAQAEADGFLARPGRLGAPAIAESAEAFAAQAGDLKVFSERLSSSLDSLEEAIETARTPVPVRVLSDGMTDIGVRSVGVVGFTEGRTIELVPGVYVFQGRREGYRDKLVEVVVSGEGDPVEVTVICDEPI